jgi:phospholipid/cholesterol/gamma-HCH transport system substrate-binding protein
MEDKMSAVRLGVFIFLGGVLLILIIFLIGNKEGMFASTFKVKAYYTDIQGLRKGATARLGGISIGSVSDINISAEHAGKVEVELRLSSDIRKFIREDSKADIETEGLVGNKVVVITMGTLAANEIKNGGVIQSIEPISFGAIIDETKGIMTYTKNVTSNLADIVQKVNQGEGSIGKLVNNDEFYQNANKLVVSADKSLSLITSRLDTLSYFITSLGNGVQYVVRDIDKVVVGVDTLVSNINQGKGLLGTLISKKSGYDTSIAKTLDNVVKMTEDAKLGASRFAEDMEALKRNWLFKGYFEQRGYYDKSEYEKQLDDYLNEINDRIKVLDQKISTLKKLEEKTDSQK